MKKVYSHKVVTDIQKAQNSLLLATHTPDKTGQTETKNPKKPSRGWIGFNGERAVRHASLYA
jgi:hypothetical protein